MNEELNNALAEVLLKATQTAEAAKGFVLSEMPDVVNQLLTWHMYKSLMFFSLSLILMGFVISLIIYFYKHSEEKPYITDLRGWFYLSSIAFICFFGFIVLNNTTWLQILIAPKLYLIEYTATLIK